MINLLIKGENLSFEESCQLFSEFALYPETRQAAILALLRAKLESLEEIRAAVQYFEQYSRRINDLPDTVDIVGTGGDGRNTLNISTAASFIIASCDVSVAKHGGGSASSKAGSSDLMASFSIKIPGDPDEAFQLLKKHHYVYLKAPVFNPALKTYGALRKQLGFPSMFNLIGPLLHPMDLKRRVIGVYRRDLLSKMADILLEKQVHHALVLHSDDGLDELSISANTEVIEIQDGKKRQFSINPESYGFKKAALGEVQGGDASQNAAMIIDIFKGKIKGAAKDVLLLNAGAGLYVSGKAKHLEQGIDMARQSLESGRCFDFFKGLEG